MTYGKMKKRRYFVTDCFSSADLGARDAVRQKIIHQFEMKLI